MNIKIGDFIYHPCSIDIMKYKVIGIHLYETFTHYELKAEHPIGACGRIEVIISENNNKLRFVELIDEDNIEYSSGLQDMIEGFYYFNYIEARKEFYQIQRINALTNMNNKERLYKEAENRYRQIEVILKEINNELCLNMVSNE